MEQKLIIESTTKGLESIVIQVPKGHRAEGLAVLNRIWPCLLALDKAIHDEPSHTEEASN